MEQYSNAKIAIFVFYSASQSSARELGAVIAEENACL
jgi:hypothetical protein